jgi:hypothetical protein
MFVTVYQSTWRSIPDDFNLPQRRWKYLKFGYVVIAVKQADGQAYISAHILIQYTAS